VSPGRWYPTLRENPVGSGQAMGWEAKVEGPMDTE
jgi:hypothetical protein